MIYAKLNYNQKTMITTPYGEISNLLLSEFCKIAGYRYENKEWTVVKDEVEYWHLVAPASMREENKWQKKLGWLPIRDLNFQYALCQCPKWIKRAMDEGKVKVYDVEKAIDYAKEKLFENGNPVYLPEVLAERADPTRDSSKKPLKSYNKILEEEESNFKNE